MVANSGQLRRALLQRLKREVLQNPWQWDVDRPGTLVVLDSDPVAEEISRRFKSCGAWLLRVRDGRVPPAEHDSMGVWKAFEFALRGLGVRQIVVCGHSTTIRVREQEPRASGFAGLIARAKLRQVALDRAKQAVVEQVEELRHELWRQLPSGQFHELAFGGAFYLAESGQFLLHEDREWVSASAELICDPPSVVSERWDVGRLL